MIQTNEIERLIREARSAKSEYAVLNSLTTMQQLIEQMIVDVSKKLKR